MTFTGEIGSSGNESEIQINSSTGTVTDPNLTFDKESKSLTVSGRIEQKVSNLTLVNQYALGSVKGIHFQNGNVVVTSGNDVLRLDDQGNTLYSVTLTGTADQIINDGIEIYVLTTSSNSITVLNQELDVISIISDPTNLPGPTRFIRFGKYLFIACGAKLSKFNTTTKSIDGTFTINADTFIDLAMKGSSLIALRQTSVSEINVVSMTLVKNVPNSTIVNPRRLKATRTNVFVLCSESLLTFDTLLKYKGKRTTGLTDARTLSIYGSFLIVANGTNGLSIYDASTIPVTLLNTIAVQVAPNNFNNGLIVGSEYYLTDSLSNNLFQFTIDGIVAGGIKAGSAEITSIESTEISAETVTATNVNTTNFYTSGSILGTSGTLGGITIADGIISGTGVQIDSGSQSLVMDNEGFKYVNNSETVVSFKNNGTFESASIETEVFKISNGVNKFQISASPDLISDQILVFPANGGTSGDMLSNDGSGALIWRAIDPAEITIPGGFTSHVQFNTDGIFSGSSKFKWDNDNEVLSIGETDEITMQHNTGTSTSTLSVGKAQTVHDTTGTRIELLDAFDTVKLVADYNDTDGATLTVGSVVVNETKITGLTTPTASTDAANKSYVDMAATNAGNSFWKNPVQAATTTNITTFPPTDGITTVTTLDTVTLTVGDRILVKDQSNPTQNGIYIITDTIWERAQDLADGSTAAGTTVKVLSGYKYALSTYNCTAGILVGTNDITFEQSIVGSGVSWKQSVRVATTVEIATFPPTDGIDTVTTIDGITIAVDDRVLVKDQSSGLQNGIYVVTSGTWERALDFSDDSVASGSSVWVNEGATYADQGWVCVSDSAIVGTTSLTFDIMSSETLPGGSNTQIQFNNGTSFAGTSDLTWDGTTVQINGGLALQDSGTNIIAIIAPTTVTTSYILALPSTIGTSGQVLSTNGTNSTTWEDAINISGTSDTHLLFNNAGVIGGSADLTWNGATLKVPDDKTITVGTDNDLVLSHSGTNTSISSTATTFNISGTGGITTLESTNAVNGHVYIKSGTTSGSSMTDFRDSAGTSILRIAGDGQIMVGVGKGYLNIRDSRNLTFGNQSDCVMVHTGSAMSMTNNLGPVTFANTDASSDFTVKIGDALGETNFSIETNTSSKLLNVSSDGTVSIPGIIQTDTSIKLKETAGDDTHFVTLQAPASIAADYAITLPVDNGSVGQFLSTDGEGVTSWSNAAVDLSASANTQLLFNDTDTITGSSDLTWDGTALSVKKIEQTSADFYIASTIASVADAQGITAHGGYLYVTSPSTNTLRIYSTNSFTDDVPVLVSTLVDNTNLDGAVFAIHSGTNLFVGGSSGPTSSFATSIDIMDPEVPTVMYKHTMGDVDGLSSMAMIGGRSMIFGETSGGYTITLDVSDPANFLQTRFYNTALLTVTGIDTVGQKVYVCGDTKIGITNVDNDNHGDYIDVVPIIYTIPGISAASAIKVQGNYAYVGDANGIHIIDVSKPETMVKIGSTYTGSPVFSGTVTDLLISGKYLYVISETTNDIQRIDISDPSTPVASGQLSVGSDPTGMVLHGSYIYITNKSGGGTVTKVNIGSAQLPQISSGSINTTNLIVEKAASFNGLVKVADGMSIGGSVSVQGHISSTSSFAVKGDLSFYGTTSSTSFISLKAPSSVTAHTLTLPGAKGTNGQVLSTDSSGVLSWTDNTLPTAKASATQLSNVNTTVDINSKAGKITTVPLAIQSHEQEIFTVTNTLCAADSIVLCNVISYNGLFNLHCGVTNITSGSFDVVLVNSSGGSLDNTLAIIGFLII